MRKPSKSNLPEKICPVCSRPFAWRKKWARDWDEVRYCSERCRREKPSTPDAGGGTPASSGPQAGGTRRG